MRRPTLSQRDRRALLAGALLAVPMAAWPLAGAPLAHGTVDARARLETRRDLLARELEVLASEETYPALADAGARAMREASPRLFEGATAGARSAALVAWVQQRARAAGVRVAEVSPMADSARVGSLAPLAVRVSGTASLEGMLTFLNSIESGDRLARISRLALSVDEASGTTVLRYELGVTGYTVAGSVATTTTAAGR